MPNWVRNKVHFSADKDELNKLQQFMKSEDRGFDFNVLIPMPESLDVDDSSEMNDAIYWSKLRKEGCTRFEDSIVPAKTWGKTFTELADLGDKYLYNQENYGFKTWFDWRCKKWGTKWNAHNPVWITPYDLEFDTAWSCPLPVFEELLNKFPAVDFYVDYADEDLGYNCGMLDIHDNVIVNHNTGYDFEFACDVWDLDPEEERRRLEEE